MLEIRLIHTEQEFILFSPEVPGWRCKGATKAEAVANCAASLRTYVNTARSLPPAQTTKIKAILKPTASG
jgi:hypothetical protein